jgi:PilZ domain-containing protein
MPGPADLSPTKRSDDFERRAFQRRRGRGRVNVIPSENPMAPGISATVVNVSQSSVKITIPKVLEVGQRVLINPLPGAAEKRPCQLRAEVCRATPSATEAHFDVVCMFIERLSYAHLQAFC